MENNSVDAQATLVKTGCGPWVSVQREARTTPWIHKIPTAPEVATIGVGSRVKINNGQEGFWVRVTAVEERADDPFASAFLAVVEEDLIRHSLYGAGDHIRFWGHNIAMYVP